MRDSSLFDDTGTTERRTPFSPPFRGGLRGEGPAPSSSARSEAAQWVRQHLPLCSAVADAFRSAFPDLRLTFASESGHVVGKPLEEPAFSVSGSDLVTSMPKKAKA